MNLISIGEPQTVPAGKYAQEVLTHFQLYEQLKPKLVLAKDVRQVLTYVITGNIDAGIVCTTDFPKVGNLSWFDSPMAIFERALSFWLLFKGLRPSGVAESDKVSS